MVNRYFPERYAKCLQVFIVIAGLLINSSVCYSLENDKTSLKPTDVIALGPLYQVDSDSTEGVGIKEEMSRKSYEECKMERNRNIHLVASGGMLLGGVGAIGLMPGFAIGVWMMGAAAGYAVGAIAGFLIFPQCESNKNQGSTN